MSLINDPPAAPFVIHVAGVYLTTVNVCTPFSRMDTSLCLAPIQCLVNTRLKKVGVRHTAYSYPDS